MYQLTFLRNDDNMQIGFEKSSDENASIVPLRAVLVCILSRIDSFYFQTWYRNFIRRSLHNVLDIDHLTQMVGQA